MKLLKSLLLSVLFVAALSFTGCNEEPTTSVTPDNTTSLSKLTLPAGAVITNATFNIYVEDGLDHDITVHKVNVPWVEATETWNIFFAKTDPEFDAASLGNFTATSGLKTVDITALVQGWVDGTIVNNGVLLNKHEVGGWLNNYRSKEYGDGSSAPYLEVTYTVGGGAPVTVQEPAFGDTYISTISPDTPFGSEILLLNGRPLVDYIKYVLVQFDIEGTPLVENCETAYAFGGSIATCFLDLSPISANNWGWTNLITPGYTGSWPMYAGAGQCDISKGTLVGHVDVSYIAGTITIDYVLDPGFNLDETHVWIGTDKLPKKNGIYQTAPGKFNYNGLDPVVLTGQTGNKYVAVHAGVCWFE